MVADFSPERLADLLREPREDLNCEIKNWLDLRNDSADKATFAKATLALANHGGGFIVLGLTADGLTFNEALGRPANLDQYNQDFINGIVRNYCEPAFHCTVHVVRDPPGRAFPVVVVPGGHKVPVQSRRAGPNGNTVVKNTVYVRKPGPRSEPPQTGQEWDELFARCIANRRDELANQIRDVVLGAVVTDSASKKPAQLENWIERCLIRWRELTENLPVDSPIRCSHGYYWFAYEIIGNTRSFSSAEFVQVVRNSEVHHTGWPPFIYLDRREIRPYPNDGAIECWLGNDPESPIPDAAHSDFWRISDKGFAFLLRGYQEDDPGALGSRDATIEPGTLFDITLPIWRVGETILHAEKLSRNLAEGAAVVNFVASYSGLTGRQLTDLNGRRQINRNRVAHQREIRLESEFGLDSIGPNLSEIVGTMLAPLYRLFDFFEPPLTMYSQELEKMRNGHY